MAPQPIESRVESLEARMTNLEQQVGPVDSPDAQVLPLRTEMRSGFSAVRADIAGLSTEMRVLHEDVIERIKLLHEAGAPHRPRKK